MRSSVGTRVCGALRALAGRLAAGVRQRVHVRRRTAPARPVGPVQPEYPALAPRDLARMRAALGVVLGHHPHVRRVLPSLAVVERALARGPQALERVPVVWLQDASKRLDSLVGDWSYDSLRQLREHLRALCEVSASALAAAPAPAPAPAKRRTRPPPRQGSELEVHETSMSMFIEAGEELASAQKRSKKALISLAANPGGQ